MQRFVSLPEPVKAGITALVVYVVSFLFANVILLVPFLAFLEAYKLPIATAAAMAVIALIQNRVPDAYAPVAVAAIQLVLAVLAVFGVGLQLAASGQLPGLLAP